MCTRAEKLTLGHLDLWVSDAETRAISHKGWFGFIASQSPVVKGVVGPRLVSVTSLLLAPWLLDCYLQAFEG